MLENILQNILLRGNVIDKIKSIEDNSIDCVITSPPYYKLRTNDVIVEWKDCKFFNNYVYLDGRMDRPPLECIPVELGWEHNVSHYIHHLELIFRECYRVLKPSGNLFVVIDDSAENGDMLVPERFCLMMVDNLNFIRKGDIIWKQNNKLPKGGVAKDRKVVRDYEHVYHFVKDFSQAYFKQLYEPLSPITIKEYKTHYDKEGTKDYEKHGVQNPSKVKANIINRAKKFALIGGVNKYHKNDTVTYNRLASNREYVPSYKGRLMRSIWVINHDNLPKDIPHFSAFPRKLVERLIDLGCVNDGIVMDIFMGSGTVALMAQKMKRRWLGIEANETYIGATFKRLEKGK